MKGTGLSKLYDQLTLDERFRLRIQAMARRDRTDCDRLDRACPSPQYQAYCWRLEASDVLTLCCLVELLPKLAKLRMVEALQPLVSHLEAVAEDGAAMGYLDGFTAGWRAAGKRGDPPTVSDETVTAAAARAYRLGTRFSDLIDRLTTELCTDARTPRDALAAFCDAELGLRLEDLLGAWAQPALETLGEYQDALDTADTDAEGQELLGDMLRVAWRLHGLNDRTAELNDELRARMEAAEGRSQDALES